MVDILLSFYDKINHYAITTYDTTTPPDQAIVMVIVID